MEEPTDLMPAVPTSFWDSVTLNMLALPSERGPTRDSKPVPLPWARDLPPHVSENVCKAAVDIAQRIAAFGLDENRPHHGFTVIVGDEQALGECGKAGFNPFHGHDLCMLNNEGVLDEEVFDTLRRNAFNADGAIVVNAKTSRVVAAGWFVGDISLGGTTGGARSRSAKAVAQQAGGCYVVKCSEDSRGAVVLHLFKERATFVGTLESDEVEVGMESESPCSRS